MKIQILALATLFASSTNGFVAPGPKATAFSRTVSTVNMAEASAQDEIAALRAAAAKAREDAARLSEVSQYRVRHRCN